MIESSSNQIPSHYKCHHQTYSTHLSSSHVLLPSLQHHRSQIPLQDRVLDRTEHHLDVMRVHCIRKVMVDGSRPLQIPLGRHEHLQDKVLHVVHGPWVPRELRVVVLDTGGGALHLHGQQIRLVQEQDDRDTLEGRVVDDRVEDVPGLLQAVRALVLGQHLVELGRGHEEEDGGDGRVEALGPLLALRALPADVHEDKRNVLDADGELDDALGRLPAVQDVLVRGHVVGPRYPVQFVQEITNRVALEGKRGETDLIVWPSLIEIVFDYYWRLLKL